MKTILLAAVVSMALLAPTASNAQFGSLINRGGEQANAPDAKAFVDSFVESYGHVLAAQVHFSEALGLKDQVDALKAEQQALGSGSIDTDRLKKVSEVSANAQRAIDERQQAQPAMDAQAKLAYGQGLGALVKGLVTGRDVVSNASSVGSSLGSNPMALMGAGRTAVHVVKEAPGYLKNLQTSAKLALEFGKNNGIEAPANATSLLGDL